MTDWILSTEPGEYPWSKVADGARRWDGIRGPLARKHLRDVKAGDGVWGYHASPQKAVVCRAHVLGPAYPDPLDPEWLAVDLAFDAWLPRPIPLSALRAHPALADMPFLRIPRLSVAPVTKAQSRSLAALGRSKEKPHA